MNQSLIVPDGLMLNENKTISKLRVYSKHIKYIKSDIKCKTRQTGSPILNCRTGNRIDHKSRMPIYTKVRY